MSLTRLTKCVQVQATHRQERTLHQEASFIHQTRGGKYSSGKKSLKSFLVFFYTLRFLQMQILTIQPCEGSLETATNHRCEASKTMATLTLMASLIIKGPLMCIFNTFFSPFHPPTPQLPPAPHLLH